MQDAVPQSVGQRLADGGQQGLQPVVLLDRPGEVDAAGRVGHAVGGVGLQGGVADQRQRAHLVQVQVRVDERLGDQPSRGIDELGARRRGLRPGGHQRGHHAVGAEHVDDAAAAEPGPGHDECGHPAVSAPGRSGRTSTSLIATCGGWLTT